MRREIAEECIKYLSSEDERGMTNKVRIDRLVNRKKYIWLKKQRETFIEAKM